MGGGDETEPSGPWLDRLLTSLGPRYVTKNISTNLPLARETWVWLQWVSMHTGLGCGLSLTEQAPQTVPDCRYV